MTGTERHLFRLGKVLIDVAVELQLSNVPDWHKLLEPYLGGFEYIEIEVVCLRFFQCFDSELPGWENAHGDCFVEILAVEVGILACQFETFVPDEGVNSQGRSRMEFHEVSLALCVIKSVGIDTEPLHHSIRSGDSTVRHSPHEHVSGFGVKELEIPEIVMS